MLSASRIANQNSAATITTLVILSCAYFTCMKKRTTKVALIVAMVSATTALSGPGRFTPATSTVTRGPISNVIQMPLYSFNEETCSDIVFSLAAVDQIQQREK